MCDRAKSRREFLRDLSVLAAGTALTGTGPLAARAAALPRVRAFPATVVVARDPGLRLVEDRADASGVARLVHAAVQRLTGQERPADAWSLLFSPNDRVGLKVNCLAGRGLSTRPEVVEAVVQGLKLAGVPEDRIVIWDRTDKDLVKGGYRIRRRGGGVKCFGTDAVAGGYEREPRIIGSVGSCFSRILTEYCTAVVNLPVLKDHDLAGVSLGMKNFYGAIHNPNKYHDHNCNPYVADLFSAPPIRDRIRLTLLDAVTGLYHGGPSYKPEWVWEYKGILAATDTVALDRIGAGMIERRRAAAGLPALQEAKREPLYIRTAGRLGLGEEDPAKIRVIEAD